MKKIPLETTLVASYRFLFTNIVSIIGTVWLPYLLVCALAAGAVYLVVPHEVLHGDFSHVDKNLILSPAVNLARFAICIAAVLAASMVIVNLMRHALGLKQNTTFIYFSLGATVWRLILAVILGALVLLLVGLLFGAIFAVFYLFGLPHIPHGYGVAAAVVLGVVLVCAFIYTELRLFFFLPAVVVAEDKIGLGRSWSLGGGNFWRMVFVIILVTIPVWFIAGIVIDLTILPVVFAETVKLPKHPHPADLIPLFRAIAYAMPVVIPTLVVASVAVRALLAGAIGTAYNAVVAAPAAAAPEEAKASA